MFLDILLMLDCLKIFQPLHVQPFLDRVAIALSKAGMGMDVNTGTLYRYPINEISPYLLL